MFALLGLVWGSSFLWIKIAEGNGGQPFLGFVFAAGAPVFHPFPLVTVRLLFGLAGLTAVLFVQRVRLPRDRQTLLAFAFMGVFNTALPFTLISWGETRIDSGLASILNGTLPLVSYIFPVVGLLLGIKLLGEQMDWRLSAGAALVVTGIVAVNFTTLAASMRS